MNKPFDPSLPPACEQPLLSALRAGSPQVYAELYRQCRPTITRFIQLNNGRAEDAVDVLQDAMIVLFRNVQKPGFTLRCKASTYLYSVCRQLWLYQLRQQKPTTDIAGYVEILPEETHTAAMAADDLVNRALQRLDARSRDLLTDYYYKNLSLTEITEHHHLPNANCAKVRKFRCLQRLKEVVKDLLRHEAPAAPPAERRPVPAASVPGR